MNSSPNVKRNPYAAALLGIIPGVGHLYQGRKARGLALLGTAILSGLALAAGPALLAPGDVRLIMICFLLYLLLVLPVMVAYSVLDAYSGAGGTDAAGMDGQTVASTLGAWGWCLMLVGTTGTIWVGLRNGGPDYLAVRLVPLALGLLGLWLVGTGVRPRLSGAAPATAKSLRAGRITAIAALAAVAVLLIARLAGQPKWNLIDFWGLVPLSAGLEILVARHRWHAAGRAWQLKIDDVAVFITVLMLVVGVVASPLRHMTNFPFTSPLQLPHIFNYGQPSVLTTDTEDGATYSIPGEPVSFTYIYSGSGNVKVVGDPTARGVSPEFRVAARGRTADEASAALDASAVVVGNSGPGEYLVSDQTHRQVMPDSKGTVEVTRDALFVVPDGVSVNIEIRFGQVQVAGVRGNVTVKTGFGQVDVSDCGGAVDVTTGWGDIRISGSTQAVSATTEFGAVYCTAERVNGPLALKTQIGKVRCSLPADAAIDLKAATKQGAVRTNFPAQRTSAYGSQSRSVQRGDASNPVHIETGFGDISITVRD